MDKSVSQMMKIYNKKSKYKKGSRFIRSYSTCLKRSPEYSKGFTLIELMVATSIFVVIMLSAMGALFMLMGASKNSRALRSAMDNVNFSMESMTRSIRMGTNYYCVPSGGSMPDPDATNDCTPEGGTYLAFVPQDSATRVAYMLHTDSVTKKSDLRKCVGNDPCIPVVSSDVDIQKLKFFVKGSSNSDSLQASVYIIMKGTVTVAGVPTSFALQTMASQRNF
jgi:prepilin-type N-terminal cleavage/methylation domain-containing protein